MVKTEKPTLLPKPRTPFEGVLPAPHAESSPLPTRLFFTQEETET